jgi:hypothetical protein
MLKFRQPEEQNPAQASQNSAQASARIPTTTLLALTKLPIAVNNVPQQTIVTPTISVKKRRFSIQNNTIFFPNMLNGIIRIRQKIQKIAQSIKKNPMRAYIWVAVICIGLEIFQRVRYQLIQNGTLSETIFQKTKYSFVTSPDGKYIFASTPIQHIDKLSGEVSYTVQNQQYSTATGKVVHQRISDFMWENRIKFSGEGKIFATEVKEGWQVFDTDSFVLKATIARNIFPPNVRIQLCDVSYANNCVLFSGEGKLYIWNATTPNRLNKLEPRIPTELQRQEKYTLDFISPIFSSNGEKVATIAYIPNKDKHYNGNEIINTWTLNKLTGKYDIESILTLKSSSNIGNQQEKRIAFSKYGDSIFYLNDIEYNKIKNMTGYNPTIHGLTRYSLSEKRKIWEIPVFYFIYQGLNISQDGKYILTFITDRGDAIINAQTGQEVMVLPYSTNRMVEPPALLSPDNRYIYEVRTRELPGRRGNDGTIKILSRQRVFLP